MNSALFTLFLIVIVAHSGESLKCYVCNSVSKKKCEFNPEAHGLEPKECTAAMYKKTLKEILSKIPNVPDFHLQIPDSSLFRCIKLDVEIQGEKMIERNCIPSKSNVLDACKLYEAMYSTMGATVQCNICEGDGCNGATTSSPTISYIFLIIITSFVLTAYRPGL